MPGADQEAELELTVEEAYRGGRPLGHPHRSRRARTLDVTIPAGVTDGQRIRLAGQGGRGSDGARPGDLYLIVRDRARIPGTGSRAATCTWSCALAPVGGGPGRVGWPWTRPAARPR